MDFASKARESQTQSAPDTVRMKPTTMTDHSARGVQLRKLAQLMQKGTRQLRNPDNEVIQLARWQLVSQNTWSGIDPGNMGQQLIRNSGQYELGTVYEDTTDEYLKPHDVDGSHLPTGSYGWWRKISRNEEQVDHFPPNAAYKGSKYQDMPMTHRPAFPIKNRGGHRPAKGEPYGFGGHASTTNSSFVQKGFTPKLTKHMQAGDYYGAMRRDIIDKSNVAFAQHGDHAAFNHLLQPGIDLAHENGSISDEEYAELIGLLLSFEDMQNI